MAIFGDIFYERHWKKSIFRQKYENFQFFKYFYRLHKKL